MPVLDEGLRKTLLKVAQFYDQRKVTRKGYLGFRQSSDLTRLVGCIDHLVRHSLLIPRQSLFLDMGCADGRVNVLLSYVVRQSVGIEVHDWILDEYAPLKKALEGVLRKYHLQSPPSNISLIHGDTLDAAVHETLTERIGVRFEEFDLFYTYLTMHEEFGELIAQKAKRGAVFMIYGLERVLPKLDGLRLLPPGDPIEGIIALYQKT
ncbi:MAG: hypothetical protein PVI20_04785 [Desulfobacteraceae bacterium]|jgi:hypothetical protein